MHKGRHANNWIAQLSDGNNDYKIQFSSTQTRRDDTDTKYDWGDDCPGGEPVVVEFESDHHLYVVNEPFHSWQK